MGTVTPIKTEAKTSDILRGIADTLDKEDRNPFCTLLMDGEMYMAGHEDNEEAIRIALVSIVLAQDALVEAMRGVPYEE